jgi:hypothetical protein
MRRLSFFSIVLEVMDKPPGRGRDTPKKTPSYPTLSLDGTSKKYRVYFFPGGWDF